MEVKRDQLEAHKLNACPKPCPQNCGAQLTVSSAPAHAAVCPNVLVSCSASNVGCVWRGQRSELKLHDAKCVILPAAPIICQLLANRDALIVKLQCEGDAMKKIAAAA